MRVWLSFADSTRPAGQQFLGACMVEVANTEDPVWTLQAAIVKAHRLGINPGGEVRSMELPDEADIHSTWFDVLLDRQTIATHDSVEGWRQPRPIQ